MYTLVLDQGTSSTRAMIFNASGECLSSFAKPVKQFYPKTGWVEHDANEILKQSIECLRQVVSQIDITQIMAFGLSNQRETCLLWDSQTGKPLSSAIVWQDTRTAEFCQHLAKEELKIHAKTGLKCQPYFSASKIRWLLDHHQAHQKKNVICGTIDSFLLWHFTQENTHQTDITNASRTSLYNLFEQQWDEELLCYFGIPRHILPEVKANDADFGMLHESIIGKSLPIRAVLGDQQAALIGVGATSAQQMKVTFGTGGFLMYNLGETPLLSHHGLLTTIAYQAKSKTHFAMEGSIYDAGFLVDWLKNGIAIIDDYEESSKLSSSIESNGGLYFIPSFSGLAAPHWTNHQGACFMGLTRVSTKAHLVRAVLESIVYQTKDILEVMPNKAKQLLVDGGMIVNQWFTQYLADVCQLDIYIPDAKENTARGVAMMLMYACDEVESLQALTQQWQHYMIKKPNNINNSLASYRQWQRYLQAFKSMT